LYNNIVTKCLNSSSQFLIKKIIILKNNGEYTNEFSINEEVKKMRTK